MKVPWESGLPSAVAFQHTFSIIADMLDRQLYRLSVMGLDHKILLTLGVWSREKSKKGNSCQGNPKGQIDVFKQDDLVSTPNLWLVHGLPC